jgi:DNA-binding SARP family transcriptional activator/TolB-like protein
MIEIKTFGRGAISRDGVRLRGLVAQKQKCSLLLYLTLEGPVSRDRLVTVFWPGRDREKARHSLSQTLYALRRELGEECLQTKGDRVEVACDRVAVDARDLEMAAQEGDWERVIELYEGPFLAQLPLHDGPEFEEWCSRTCTRLARLANRAFAQLVERRAAAGLTEEALAVATRWAKLEPHEDEAQHAVVALLALSGDRTAALRQFDAYRGALARDLQVEPLEETLALVERIRAGEAPEFSPLSSEDRAAEEVPRSRRTGEAATLRPLAPRPGSFAQLMEELRTRLLYQVLAAYVAVSWLAMEFTGLLIERAMLPEWVFPLLLTLLVIVLPFVAILAWAQEAAAVDVETARLRWPRWASRARPKYVLATLGTLVLGLLAGLALLGRSRPSDQVIDAAVAFDPTKIAILYFDDRSADSSLASLARGLTEDLINRLHGVHALSVISAAGVKPFAGKSISTDSIGRSLGVGALVDGIVEPLEDSVSVTVHIVHPYTAQQVHVFTVNRRAGELLALRRDIGEEVQRLLRVWIGSRVTLRQLRDETSSDSAWMLVQYAKGLIEDSDRLAIGGEFDAAAVRLDRADSLLALAEELDPRWLAPILERGELTSHQADLVVSPTPGAYAAAEPLVTDILLAGIGHSERALEAKPSDARALDLRARLRLRLLSFGALERSDTLLDAAARDASAATERDPSLARAWYTLAKVLLQRGRTAEAKLAAEKALAADIYFAEASEILVWMYWAEMSAGEFAAARQHCNQGRRHFPDDPNFMECELTLLCWSRDGPANIDRAWRIFEELDTVRAVTHGRIARLFCVTAVAARAGLADSARSLLSTIRASIQDPRDLPAHAPIEAYVWALLGEHDRALELLDALLEESPGDGAYWASHPWFYDLQDHPRFRELTEETN